MIRDLQTSTRPAITWENRLEASLKSTVEKSWQEHVNSLRLDIFFLQMCWSLCITPYLPLFFNIELLFGVILMILTSNQYSSFERKLYEQIDLKKFLAPSASFIFHPSTSQAVESF